MHLQENQKSKILEIIRGHGSLTELKNYIQINNISLSNLNCKTFDTLIYSIIHDASYNTIKYILDECHYKTLNYVFVEGNVLNPNNNRYLFFKDHKVPLFIAILKQNYKVADLLLKNKADINYCIIDFEGKDNDILQYLFAYSSLDISRLKYVINNGFKVKNITNNLIIDLIKSNYYGKTDILDNLLKSYVFDISFILNLLSLYRNKRPLSTQQLQTLITKEKKKIEISDSMYDIAIYEKKYDILDILLECDGSDSTIILSRIYKYEILENSVEACRFNSNYNLIKKILNMGALDFKWVNMDSIIIETCKKKNVKIMNVFIESLLNHKEYDLENIDFEEILIQIINEEEETDVVRLAIESFIKLNTFNINYINFENILTEVCRRNNMNVIKLFFDILKSEKLLNEENIDIENILLETIRESNAETINLYIETVLNENSFDICNFNVENILLESSRRGNFDIMKLILETLLHNEKINFKIVDFENILIEACKEYNGDIIQLLIDIIFKYESIDSNSINFENVIAKASRNSHIHIFEVLINALSSHCFDIKSITIEKILSEAKHNYFKKDNVKLFLEKLLNISFEKSLSLNISSINHWREDILILLINLIIEVGNVELLRFILEEDEIKQIVNINTKDIYNKYPIILAFEAIKYYIHEYLSTKYNSMTHYRNSIDIFKYLLEYGASCNPVDLEGISLLSLAINKKYYNVIKYLLKYKVFVVDDNDTENQPFSKMKNIYQNVITGVKLLSIKGSNYNGSSSRIKYNECNFTSLTFSYLLNYKEIFRHLSKHTDINELDVNGYSLLYYAILKEDEDMINYLIDNDVNINDNNNTALTISLCIGNKKIFYLLLSHSILNLSKNSNDLLLISILKSFNFTTDDKIDMIKCLIKKGFKLDNICQKYSPLIYSIQMNSMPLVQFFIENGVVIDCTDESGDTPLICAIQNKSIPIVTLLLEHGANPNLAKDNSVHQSDIELSTSSLSSSSIISDNNSNHSINNSNLINSNGESFDTISNIHSNDNNKCHGNSQDSPLMYAIQEESLPLIKLLINYGADVNFTLHGGISPLILAVQKNSIPMVELLLHYGAQVNITDGLWEYSSLIYAIEEDSLSMAKLLIDHGANVNYGRGTLIRSAIKQKSVAILQLLLENGAKVNEIAIIMYAVRVGDLEIFKYLYPYAANINFSDRYDSNSLIKSIDKSGKTEIFEYLIKHNLNDISDKIVKNIIFNNQLELLKILMNNNFDINFRDDEGNTLLVYAIKNCNKSMVDYLISIGANISNINNEGQSIFDISYQYSYDYWGEKIFIKIKELVHNNSS